MPHHSTSSRLTLWHHRGVRCTFHLVLLLCGCDQLFVLPPVEPPDVLDAGLACPADYTLAFESRPVSRYKHVTALLDWRSAADACDSDRTGATHLVVLDDEAERVEAIMAVGTTADVWIGLTDQREEAVYLWVTEQPVAVPLPGGPPWADDRPDDTNHTQNCVRMNPGHLMRIDDNSCANTFQFLCECDGWASDPRRY